MNATYLAKLKSVAVQGGGVWPFIFGEQLAKVMNNSTIVRFEYGGHGLSSKRRKKFNPQVMKVVDL